MPGRWLVDYRKKSAIYQPLTHYSTTCYTPAGRYGRFFALIKFCKHTLLETRHNYLCTSAKSVGEKFCNKFCEFCEFRGSFLFSNKLLPRSLNEAPTDFTEHTEQTGRGYSPTDCTDPHRYLYNVKTPTEFTKFTEQFACICVNP